MIARRNAPALDDRCVFVDSYHKASGAVVYVRCQNWGGLTCLKGCPFFFCSDHSGCDFHKEKIIVSPWEMPCPKCKESVKLVKPFRVNRWACPKAECAYNWNFIPEPEPMAEIVEPSQIGRHNSI